VPAFPALLSGNGASLRTASRILRAEGIPAFRDRISDRLRERNRRRAFREAGSPLDLPPAPVLNLLTTAPNPRLGGLQLQLLHRIENEAERRPLALLYPEPGSYRLEVTADGQRLSLRIRSQTPPSPAALTDSVYEQAVSRAAAEVGARALHVEGFAGVPLVSLLRLQESGLQLVLSVHDFSLFCLRPHLLETPAEQFCGYSRDAARCARCLATDWQVPAGFQETRRAVARELLLRAAAVVYPSEFLRGRYRELFPGIPPERQRVIEPRAWVGGEAPAPLEHPPSHIAYIGSVQPHKGALVFAEIVRQMPAKTYPELRWSIYGGGDADLLMRLRRLPHLRVRGYYRAGSLVELLRRDRVGLALLLSIVPESYSLALSECLAAGVPVVAFDHGAIAERVRKLGGGLLVEPTAGAAGVVSVLAAVASGLKLPSVVQPAAGEPTASGDDASAFEELYRELGLG